MSVNDFARHEERRGRIVSPLDGRLALAPKHPPHDMEAEQSVLGGLVLNNRAWDEVRLIVRADDFYTQDHRLIFYGISDLLDESQPCDVLTLSNKLRDQGNFDNAGGSAYLHQLTIDSTSYSNVKSYAGIVAQKATFRRLIAAGQDIAELGYQSNGQDPEALVNAAVQIVATIQAQKLGRSCSQTFQALAQEAVALFRKEGELRRAGKLIGACTGLQELDALTGGFHGSRLIIVAARPKCGKTALLNKLALHSAKSGVPGYVCSIEMGGPETAARILSTDARANISNILRGNEPELRMAEASTARLGELPLWLDFETNRLDAICAQIALHRQQKGIEWAAVDHIGLVSTAERFNSLNDKLGHISQTLKRLAKRLKMPIIALCQLGRDCDRTNRRPLASDLRDSGNLEQDADMVMMLHVPLAERMKAQRQAHIGVTANRAGPSFWLPKPYMFDGRYQEFGEFIGPAPNGYGDDLPPASDHWQDR